MAEHANGKTYNYKGRRVIAEDGVSENWYLDTAGSGETSYTLVNSDCHKVEVIYKKSHNGSTQSDGVRVGLSSGDTANDKPYHYLEAGDSIIIQLGNKVSGAAFYVKSESGGDEIILVRELLS